MTRSLRTVLPLAALAAAPLLVVGAAAQARQAPSQQNRQQSQGQQSQTQSQRAQGQRAQGQQAQGQNAQGQNAPGQQAQAQQTTSSCRFTSGARKGSTVDFSATPGVAAVPVGSPCGDMTGSTGVAVAQQSARAPGQGRFYRTPESPVGLNPSGQPTSGYTLTCRYTSGPNAGSSHDFSGMLGATPIRIGKACSDGTNKGIGIAPPNQGSQGNQGGQGPQG